MKEYYTKTNFEERRKCLDRMEDLTDILEHTELDFATFSVSEIGSGLIRIFFYPVASGKFSEDEARKLMRTLDKIFTIQNTLAPEGTSSYCKSDYSWSRDYREDEGSVMWRRNVKDFFTEPKCDLLLFLERIELGKTCKMVEKTITKKVYEMECK